MIVVHIALRIWLVVAVRHPVAFVYKHNQANVNRRHEEYIFHQNNVYLNVRDRASMPIPSHKCTAATDDNLPHPPVAFRNESSFVLAGDIGTNIALRQSPSSPYPLLTPPRPIPDPYGWLRDDSRSNKTVLAHIHSENEYTYQMTSHLEPLRNKLYQELLSTICETDCTPPIAQGSYWYYQRWEEGVSYPRYCRAPRNDLYPPKVNEKEKDIQKPLLPGEEVYLDVPLMAQNKTYIAVGAVVISPNEEYVAFSVDETGDEVCHFHVKNIASGQEWVLYSGDRRNKLKGYGAIEWDGMSRGIFYVTFDQAQRPNKVFYRQLFRKDGSCINGLDTLNDNLLFEEVDEVFNVHIAKSLDSRYLFVMSNSKESNEVNYLDLHQDFESDYPKKNDVVCVSTRQKNILYRITHCNGYWLVVTNVGHLPNFALKVCRVGETCNIHNLNDVVLSKDKTPVFDGGIIRSLDHITVFNPLSSISQGSERPFAYAVATGREDGLPRVWILELSEDNLLCASKVTHLEFLETAFDVSVGSARDPTLPYVVVNYNSLITPLSTIAIPLANPSDLDKRRVLKEVEVPSYEKDLYLCERTTVKSRDGIDIPVSLVYRRDAIQAGEGNIPVHLLGELS